MELYFGILSGDDYRRHIVGDQKDTVFQIVFSLSIGLSAFIAFCILRPRWPTLYAARKRQKDEAEALPELPHSLVGWLPVLWGIGEDQVLASAGLDAFVFLAFFKMAIKFLAVALVFALVIIKPVHDYFPEPDSGPRKKPNPGDALSLRHPNASNSHAFDEPEPPPDYGADYLWMYLVFAYFFTGLVFFFVITESKRIINIRQNYLGSQSTITDRTIRLSGIPADLQSEDKIKEFIEELEIGTVESVTLCRDWKKLDDAMDARNETLRKLEEALVEHERGMSEAHFETLPTTNDAADGDGEDRPLLEQSNRASGQVGSNTRPSKRIWFGPLKMNFKFVDAIDYYEEKLRRLDHDISRLRNSFFPTRSLAFVTMDSVASCQMAVQAVLDSSPLQLLATPSPSPVDVAWQNTYMSYAQRLVRSWTVTAIIVVLTVFWSVLLVPIAGLMALDRIHQIWPTLAELLDHYPLAKSLVTTQLPTLVLTLLYIGVPFFYSWLSHEQGMISQGDIELSTISKNFFFMFFNFFVVFTALGTASMSLEGFGTQPLRETALELARSLQALRQFYVNFIILQALGLLPLRLLEFGSVALYPFGMMMAKTPRDYAEFVQPPIFNYGYFLPQTILIFLICIVYSVLRSSWHVLLPGLAYFMIGYVVYKYQLLYAMDHQQHSTGKGWVIIVDRIVVGLVVFQVTMAGQLALRSAFRRSVGIVPLVALTLWFSYEYNRSYTPLMTYIALRSIRRAEHSEEERSQRQYTDNSERRMTLDESREFGLRFINPNLVIPLETPWVSGKRPRPGLSRGSSLESSVNS